MIEEIGKVLGEILKGNFAAPFIVILIIGFGRVASLLLTEKDKRLEDSRAYSESIAKLNEAFTRLEIETQESNKLLISKIDGFISGAK